MSAQRKRPKLTALAYDKRGRLLSVGTNSYIRTHPLQAKYSRKAGKPDAIYIHAELAALLKARGKVHKLVVVRYGKKGQPLLAKPCAACQLAINDWNVEIVEHT